MIFSVLEKGLIECRGRCCPSALRLVLWHHMSELAELRRLTQFGGTALCHISSHQKTHLIQKPAWRGAGERDRSHAHRLSKFSCCHTGFWFGTGSSQVRPAGMRTLGRCLTDSLQQELLTEEEQREGGGAEERCQQGACCLSEVISGIMATQSLVVYRKLVL